MKLRCIWNNYKKHAISWSSPQKWISDHLRIWYIYIYVLRDTNNMVSNCNNWTVTEVATKRWITQGGELGKQKVGRYSLRIEIQLKWQFHVGESYCIDRFKQKTNQTPFRYIAIPKTFVAFAFQTRNYIGMAIMCIVSMIILLFLTAITKMNSFCLNSHFKIECLLWR